MSADFVSISKRDLSPSMKLPHLQISHQILLSQQENKKRRGKNSIYDDKQKISVSQRGTKHYWVSFGPGRWGWNE